jgi:hypothetical protein
VEIAESVERDSQHEQARMISHLLGSSQNDEDVSTQGEPSVGYAQVYDRKKARNNREVEFGTRLSDSLYLAFLRIRRLRRSAWDPD